MPVGCLILPRFMAETQALRNPGLRGRAIGVHRRGRLISCSRQAEQAGLAIGMPLGRAQAVCPQAELIAYIADHYRAHQRRVLDICAAHAAAVEPVSFEEIFLDLDGAGPPAQIMAEVAEATDEQGFTCRLGAAPGKLVARIAALVRPGTAVVAGKEGVFLAPLPVSQLWMLDGDTIEHLQALGIHTIGLLQQTPLAQLTLRFGRKGRRLGELAFGRDATPVRPLYPPQVVETRIALDGVGEAAALEACLRRLASRIAEQLGARRRACDRLSLEIETDDGQAPSRSLRLAAHAHTEDDLFRAARRLLARIAVGAPVTALTLRADDLRRCESVQADLFGVSHLARRKRDRLAGALASARQQFGSQTVRMAGDLEVPRRERLLALHNCHSER